VLEVIERHITPATLSALRITEASEREQIEMFAAEA
jgi:hypothetical protein